MEINMKGSMMSESEANRLIIIGQVLDKKLSQKHAAKILGISTRQVRRSVKRLRTGGTLCIAHKNRNKPSTRRINADIEEQIIHIIKLKYPDFGPTLAAEKLAEIDGIKISNETLRKLLIKHGLWKAKQNKRLIHQPRARRPRYGELIQIDGSHHDWFEGRAPKCVALVFVDDATSSLQLVHFCNSEDLQGYFTSMKQYVEKYGCPQEIYTDKHSVFTVNHMRGGEQKGKTQFARMLKDLNITQNLANSPQAKGRVERMNRVLQDRLVKEFRIANISTIAEANAFMPAYVEKHNRNFAITAAENINAHTHLHEMQRHKIDRIFSIQDSRKVSKALTVQYENKIYIISNVRAIRTLIQRGVKIYEMLDGTIKMFSSGQELSISLLEHADNYRKPLSRKELDIQMDANNFAKIQAANVAHQTSNAANFFQPR